MTNEDINNITYFFFDRGHFQVYPHHKKVPEYGSLKYLVTFEIRDIPFRNMKHFWFEVSVNCYSGIAAMGCGLNYQRPLNFISIEVLEFELTRLMKAMVAVKKLTTDEIFLSGIYDIVV